MRRHVVAGLIVAQLALVGSVMAQTTSPPITTPGDRDTYGGASNNGDGTIGVGVGTGSGQNTSTGSGGRSSSSGGSGGTTDTTVYRPSAVWVPADDPAKIGTCQNGGRNGITIRICYFDPNAGTPTGPPPRGAVDIAADASTRVLPLPGVHTSPPTGSDQLVNLPTWLWVDNWQPQSASASEGGLRVTVTATPRSVTWRMGMGEAVVCREGIPWNPDLREEQQSSDCTFTYKASSAHQPDLKYFASATMAWDVTWTATNGESGSLGRSTRTTDFRMRVAEGQALVISSG